MTKAKLSTYQLPQVPDPLDRLYLCVPVPNDVGHIRAFLGQIDALSYWWAWDRDPAKTGRIAARQWLEIAREIRASLDNGGGCSTVEFRQNPDDSCQLQYRNSPDDTWSLAFDYGLCLPPAQGLILDALNQNSITLQRIAGDITNININAPLVSFTYQAGTTPAQNQNRDGALCYAVEVYIQLAKQAIEQEINNALTGINLVNLAGAAVLGIAGAVLTGGVAFGLAMAVWSAVFGIGSTILGGNAQDVLLDPIAETDVRCLMYDRLKNAQTDVNSFSESLRPASLTGNSELLRQAVYGLMQVRTDEQFRAFINLLAQADVAATAGSCLCPEDCKLWDFAFGGAELLKIDPTTTNAPGGILGLRVADGYQSVTDQRAGQNYTSLAFTVFFAEPIDIASITWESSAQTIINGGERYTLQFLDADLNSLGQTGQASPTFPALNTRYERVNNFAVPPTGVSAVRYVANGGTNSQSQRWTVHNFEVCLT